MKEGGEEQKCFAMLTKISTDGAEMTLSDRLFQMVGWSSEQLLSVTSHLKMHIL